MKLTNGGIKVKDYVEQRATDVARYIIDTKCTIRQAAKKFGVSKSTIHKDITERVIKINPALYSEARSVLDVNLVERTVRGGIATKKKYKGN